VGATVGAGVIRVHLWAVWSPSQPLLHQYLASQAQVQSLLPF
jgi:hypothetical protein